MRAGCKMRHEAREQDVMDMKLSCQQNWAECILNPNQIPDGASCPALRSPAAAYRRPLTFGIKM